MNALADFVRDIQRRDEARPTVMEVILAYPGFHIMTVFYPLAHLLWHYELRALARFWMNFGRMVTGVDIHPGARIGRNLFIDHGAGVVIGETAVIGGDCRIYHGVTLGGRGGEAAGEARHPRVGNGVIIGANALVLGPITIGDGARIGAGSMVTKDVPAGFIAIGSPARLIADATGACAYGLPDGPLDAGIFIGADI